MHIGIILHPYGEKKPGGLARTIFEWTKALLEIDKKNEYIIFLKDKPAKPLNLPGNNWKMEVLGGGFFWKDRLKKSPKADIYLFQTPVLPIFYTPHKSIIIVQDYPYKYLPAKSMLEKVKYKIMDWHHGHSLKRADAIIAVSNSSKEDTSRFFNIDKEKIEVIYMGYKKICDVPQEELSLPKKFFLFVGVVKERKNFLNIIKAFALFKKDKKSEDFKLVVAGKGEGDYFNSAKDYIEKENLGKDVIFLDYLNDGQLSFLYRRATALVFPSLVESFGFPVLEAMDCGIPVITTKYQGPSEIANDAGILVNPQNPAEIQRAMEKIISDDLFRQKLINVGKQRSGQFSWQLTAQKTLDFINSL